MHPMSGSALRFGHILTSAGCAQWPLRPGPIMGTGNSGAGAVLVLLAAMLATRCSSYDTYGAGCAIRRTTASLRRQAAECHNET